MTLSKKKCMCRNNISNVKWTLSHLEFCESNKIPVEHRFMCRIEEVTEDCNSIYPVWEHVGMCAVSGVAFKSWGGSIYVDILITEVFWSWSTLQMLTNIENRLEELFEMIETMPQDKVEAAEKVRDWLWLSFPIWNVYQYDSWLSSGYMLTCSYPPLPLVLQGSDPLPGTVIGPETKHTVAIRANGLWPHCQTVSDVWWD